MVAQTQARNITVSVNGIDYTQYFSDLSVGFDSWQQGKGIIRKTGELALVEISGGDSLDPRDNSDLQPGNVVTVTWGGGDHPLAESLLVLAPPTIEPLLSNLPTVTGNIRVTIPIGCALAYYQANEPDDDKSGVTLGSGQNGAAIATALLEAAGIDADSIDISEWDREIDYPIQKQGGGFVDLAGEIAYCTVSEDQPGFLYCDSSNTVQAASLDPEADSTRMITLGTNDRGYTPQLDGSIPPGTVRAVGVRKRVVTGNVCEKVVSIENKTVRRTSQVCRFSEWEIPGLWIPAPEFYVSLAASKMLYEDSTTEEKVGKSWVQLSKVSKFQAFSRDDRLGYTTTISYEAKGLINSDIAGEDYYDSIAARVETEGYVFDGDSVRQRRLFVWDVKARVNPGLNTEDEDPWEKVKVQERITTWRQIGNLFQEQVSDKQARILVDTEWVGGDDSSETAYDLIASTENSTTTGNTGQTHPPRVQYWEPLESEEEDFLEASAKFSKSVQQEVLQISHAFDTAQMQGFAEIEGEIIWGRAYQYLIEVDPTLFTTQQSPMAVVTVAEPSRGRQFLADALSWVHTGSETYVGFAGIYLGSTASASPGASRSAGVAPMIIRPTAPNPVRPELPRGLATDGVIAAGTFGIVRVGLVGGGVTVG